MCSSNAIRLVCAWDPSYLSSLQSLQELCFLVIALENNIRMDGKGESKSKGKVVTLEVAFGVAIDMNPARPCHGMQ